MNTYNLSSTPFVKKMQTVGIALLAVGAIGLGSMAVAGMNNLYAGYILGFMYVTGISVTLLFFSTLTYLANAGWAVSIRRVAELLSGNVKFGVPLFLIPLAILAPQMYRWWSPEGHLAHMMDHSFKGLYLDHNFFYARLAFYALFWWFMHSFIVGNSIKQDTATDIEPTKRNWKRAAPFVIGYAVTITFIAFDLLMSLEPEWFSTIFGIYYFAGNFVSTISIMLIFMHLLNQDGLLKGVISREHYHDLGKFMFAFTVFWAYISFSQYYIIWYGNMPEETFYYSKRLQGGWEVFGWSSLFVHFFTPFLFLLRQDVKRNPSLVILGAVLILGAHFIDLSWVVLPAFGGAHGEETAFSLPLLIAGISGVLLMGGVFLIAGAQQFKKHPAVAYNDPYLYESLEYQSGSYDRL